MKILSLFAVICLGVVDIRFVVASPTRQLNGGKVVNGQDAIPGSHPHQVTLQWYLFGSWFHICGGSVIDDLFVLTAAHCVDFAPAEQFRVVVNDHNLYNTDGDEQFIGIQRIYTHEKWLPGQDYDYKLYPNDIAVLRLDSEVLDKTTIIHMADDDNEDFTGDLCTISGWGRNDTNGIVPNTLQEVNMTVMNQTDCNAFWKDIFPDAMLDIFQGQICIFSGEDPESGASACSGDSGGPMVCNGVLAGVTSWGVQGCRDPVTREFRPSVYVRVSYYYPWIQNVQNLYQIGRG
ncbi:trypsin-2-like [Mercenaria mercenaria]|uniref:trypsin-2-like n=1 Tax=Mercenaria mercenaria TaxID=6596 RepID=UPI00234F9661|nr:trypsin-2-like [Mercenaria mercenaria]